MTVALLVLTLVTGAGSPPAASPADPARQPGALDAVSRQPGTLSEAQRGQAMAHRARLTPADRGRLDAVLAGAAPAEAPYAARAFAAGHSVAEVTAFAALIAGRDRYWLRAHLRPIDPAGLRYTDISQYDDTTCGPTTIVAARALVDPVYALWLTTAGRPDSAEERGERQARRLRTEEQRVHDEADVLWPQVAGTPPWGVSELMSNDPAGLGARYRWFPALPLLGGVLFRRAVVAAERGYPVPLLIGDAVPRHYVLLLGRDTFYEPTRGAVVVLGDRELRRRDFGALGWPRLLGVALPGSVVPGR
ncbi:hypothetical protein [Actinoplanes sp. RD1]|uniref:hypothetical protein n=1 Tax=Actinoplanes sp. RD1 TaxID=3064538 RepID=UPI00274237A4|nr:hypothetical protein [Actinoplanes sp. RD1]